MKLTSDLLTIKQALDTFQIQTVTLTHLFGNLADRLYAGAVQVSVVLSGLDELMTLNVSFHLLTRHDEVIVATVNLVRPASTCRVWQSHNGYLLLTY